MTIFAQSARPSRTLAVALLVTILALLLAACGDQDAPARSSGHEVAADTREIASAPWLRERLPADTIAYVRLPSPWALLSAPNGKATDVMYATPENVQAVTQLRQALASFGLDDGTALDEARVGAVIRALNGLSGPIEMAVIAPGRVFTPATQVLLSVALDTDDPARVSDYLEALDIPPGARAPLTFDDQGMGRIQSPAGTVLAHFDRDQRRLLMLGGNQVGDNALSTLLPQLATASSGTHAMHTLEAEIDSHGQGLFAWMDMTAVKPMLMLTLDGNRLWLRHVYEATRAIALGWGSVDGHGRLSLRAELTDPAWLAYLPRTARKLDLRLRGTPGYVFTLALPSAAEAQAILDQAVADNPPLAQDWQALDRSMREAVGFGPIETLEPFGTEMLAFSDDAGDVYASRLVDADRWHALVDTMKAHGHHHETRAVSGGTVHYLRLRFNEEAPPWQQIPVHLYWIEQDGWMVYSTLPQPLIDRLALPDTGGLDDWLRQTQGDDRSRALLSLSGTAQRLARLHYHAYLSVLNLVSDNIGSPIDLFDLPTAHQLGLPAITGMGLQLIADDNRLALDLNYQHSALDGVIGGGGGAFTLAALAGITSAISLPAYQDYTLRAHVASSLAEASALRLELAEHYANHGRLLTDPSALDQPVRRLAADNGRVEFDNGAIAIIFDDDAEGRLAGKHLYLLPYRDANGSLGFTCGEADMPDGATALMTMEPGIARTDIPDRYLPGHCRP